ncbi:hypothetical protein IRZ81_11800 [Pseudomonas putida]|uniref:hypothetical protein n=1 Tax=Pseudomonas putida TaxID=303 RepID=UPI0018AA5410|nr:hypothetical protein [Pseudomonas putida]MBF8651480.1 hypothetical protein [Pseudomonas putida]MBF8655548.1 hypothetical protein [Pseudomonas putida]
MTTIIVKDADFSSGDLINYAPPVSGATLCAFVGDTRDAASLKNYGSGQNLSVYQGAPKAQGDGFRRFGAFDSYKTDSYYTPEMTMLVVARSVYPLTDQFGIVISSERDNSDGGRRGAGIVRLNNADYLRMYVNGTLNGAPTAPNTNTQVPGVTQANSAAFSSGTFAPGTTPNTVVLGAQRHSAPTVARSVVSDANPTLAPASNESSFPLLVGSHYRPSGNFAPVDIGFVAVYPRVLTAEEIQKMYASVKRRFASFGVAI